ncbi:MAG: CAP domain-containing protein [Prolixibacteraceae bacterium]|jgi:uncharacterized protein YkwD|nr:CAP domain-containing protein [Prolixibacteraceae bacterium]
MGIFQHFLVFILLFFQTNWDGKLNTGLDAGYMSPTEKAVLFEINKVRNNPVRYADEYLEPMKTYYNGNKLAYPGQMPIITSEGRKALDECLRFLKNAGTVSPLQPDKGLFMAARDHVNDQQKNGGIGHFGKDSSKPVDRIERYGNWDVSAAENIAYGIDDARKVVISLLIDDGVPGRGHRTNLLNPSFTVVGISLGNHPDYGSVCVMDFAGAYQSKLP